MEYARPPAELLLEGGPAARSDAWYKWRKQFEVFLKASGVSREPQEVQASLLVNLVGPAGHEAFTTFIFGSGESEDDLKCVLKKFDEYFGAQPNITMRRHAFFMRDQRDDENIDRYVTSLRVLAAQCEFGELRDSLIRDRIVCGTRDGTVRDRLLRAEALTLTRAIYICQAAEMSREAGEYLAAVEVRVHAVTSRRRRRANGRRTNTADVTDRRGTADGIGRRGTAKGIGWRSTADGKGWRGMASGTGDCGISNLARTRVACHTCGSRWCRGGSRCRAQYDLCYMCDRVGHYSRVCARNGSHKRISLKLCAEDSDKHIFINAIKEKRDSDPMISDRKVVIAKVETGSKTNVTMVRGARRDRPAQAPAPRGCTAPCPHCLTTRRYFKIGNS